MKFKCKKTGKIIEWEPILICASLVSAQRRRRLFWTNIPNVTLPEDRGILLKDILEENVEEKYNVHSDNWRVQANLRDVDGKSKCLNASNYKGALNDGMSLIRIGQIGKGGQGDRIYSPDGKSVGLSALGGGRGAKTGLYAVARASVQKNAEQYSDGKTPALTSAMGMGGGNVPLLMDEEQAEKLKGRYIDGTERQVIRKLTPIECERLQSLPDNYTEWGRYRSKDREIMGDVKISNSQRYKCLGNAFNCAVVKHILSFIK